MTKFDQICLIIKENIKTKFWNHFFDKIQNKCKKNTHETGVYKIL